MDALNPCPMTPAQRFHALFDSNPFVNTATPEPGMPRKADPAQKDLLDPTQKRQATGIRPNDVAWMNYLDLYVGHVRLRSKSGHCDHVDSVLRRFTEYRGLYASKLREVTTVDIELYLAERMKDHNRSGKPLTERTLNNEVDILNACFAYAGPKDRTRGGRKHLGWVTDPAFCEPLPEPDVSPVELTDEQIENFIRATKQATVPQIEGCSPADFWLAVLVLESLTLLRRRALLLVKRPTDEILLERKELFIPAAINKTNQDAIVTLGTTDAVPQLFHRLPSRVGEPLLPWRSASGKPLSLGYFSDTIRKMQEKAGIPDGQRLKLKYLRSTSANKVEDAFDEATAKSKLKHGPNTNTYRKHYRKRAPKPKEIAATDSLAGWLFGVLKSADTPAAPALRVIG